MIGPSAVDASVLSPVFSTYPESAVTRNVARSRVKIDMLTVSSGARPCIILEGAMIDTTTAAWYIAATRMAG